MNKKGKILVSIDGGGIRGIFPLLFLAEINKRLKQINGSVIQNHIDVVAGTSAGAIIAGGIMSKLNDNYLYSVEELLQLYCVRGPQLFNLSKPGHIQSDGLRLLLKRKFKGITLNNLSTDYIFVSFDIKANEPFLFHSFANEHKNRELALILSACSAIPGYFSPIKIDGAQLIDGIATAKNPATILYSFTQKHYPLTPLTLISFGTGQLTGELYDSIEEATDEVHNTLKIKAKNSSLLTYFRLQPEIRIADPGMDAASSENIEKLIADGNYFIKNNKGLFEKIIACLV